MLGPCFQMNWGHQRGNKLNLIASSFVQKRQSPGARTGQSQGGWVSHGEWGEQEPGWLGVPGGDTARTSLAMRAREPNLLLGASFPLGPQRSWHCGEWRWVGCYGDQRPVLGTIWHCFFLSEARKSREMLFADTIWFGLLQLPGSQPRGGSGGPCPPLQWPRSPRVAEKAVALGASAPEWLAGSTPRCPFTISTRFWRKSFSSLPAAELPGWGGF